jgi:hypothetical protein
MFIILHPVTALRKRILPFFIGFFVGHHSDPYESMTISLQKNNILQMVTQCLAFGQILRYDLSNEKTAYIVNMGIGFS